MDAADGIITHPSHQSVAQTLDKLEALLREKGITVFIRIDHSGEAKKVGLEMPPTQLLIFGNPSSGTPIMLASPVAAIDLPLKALAWQDAEGGVWLSYNDPRYLQRRFGLGDESIGAISGIGKLIEKAVA